MSTRSSLPPRNVASDLHALTVKTIKGLTMDAVQAAGSGHPGMPMGAADMATVLWTQFLVHDPKSPTWHDRDRFVLSAGHGSMLLYSLLHLSGYDLSLADIRNFRQWGSKTPGHPEYRHTPGVEITTGPLGTGFASGVGMALAERHLAARYNIDGHEIVDHMTYGIVSDGDLMEGISAEAAALAGHLGLGKLVYLWDDNEISIDGGTELTFSERVPARFEAQGWHVQSVDGHDPVAVAGALAQAKAENQRPSLIACRTEIGQGSPNKAGTSASHGAPLGVDEVAATKAAMDWPADAFYVPDGVAEGLADQQAVHAGQREAWEARFAGYEAAHPQLAREFLSLQAGELPEGIFDDLPEFADGEALASRQASGKVLAALSRKHPTLLGGSADLAGSNNVNLPDTTSQSKSDPSGRNIHFGVREHAMAAICNGIALHGGLRPFDATFLIFSDFMRGALRLSALMKLPVVHVFTHDSFWVGEDGPTHQPIEHAMSLRAMPGLRVIRPADPRETVGAWRRAMQGSDGPTALLLTRQKLVTLTGSRSDVSCGAYVIWEPEGVDAQQLHGILIATGSEVAICVEAAQRSSAAGKPVRVVSMPCWEDFAQQSAEYRDSVLPPSVTRRLSVEAGVSLGWQRYAAEHHGIDDFGASAPGGELAQRFGFTADAVFEHYQRLA